MVICNTGLTWIYSVAVRLPTVGEPVSEMVTRKPTFSAVNDVVVLPVSVMIPFVAGQPCVQPVDDHSRWQQHIPGASAIV